MKKPYKKKKKANNPFKQGKELERCKGCSWDYNGYCLACPFDKPKDCVAQKKIDVQPLTNKMDEVYLAQNTTVR